MNPPLFSIIRKKMESKIIDHLGLVSGSWDELQISETIDQAITQDETCRNASIGTLCKSLVLNGLGFTERALYLVSDFFTNKPTSLLLGEGIEPEHLNDTVLGRALDAVQDYGTTKLFSQISLKVVSNLGLSPSKLHMDSTDFHVDGVYNSNNKPDEDSSTVFITKGYSRDHRPDLNQVVLNMITDSQAGIPLHMEVLNGNCSDKTAFKKTISKHIKELQNIAPSSFIVMDSAGYTKEGIAEFSNLTHWISRVPESIKEARDFITENQEWTKSEGGYQYAAKKSTYAGVQQRWILVFSQEAFVREMKTLSKNYVQSSLKEYKIFKKISKEQFTCEDDAKKALLKFNKHLKFIALEDMSIRKVKQKKKSKNVKNELFCISATVVCSIDNFKNKAISKGKFIVATNQMDDIIFNDIAVIKGYKEQSNVERGFRFIKDPQFVASNFFVKKPERLEALVFIMTLCLTVYAALEYKIRKALKEENQTINNQIGKPKQNPTSRWIFQIFSGIHILYGLEKEIVLNVKDVHLKILDLLGENYKKYYF